MVEPTYSDRGFKHLDPITTGEDEVRAYESSAASAPHIWVSVNEESIHLNLEQVDELIKQLEFLKYNHYQLEDGAPDNCCCQLCGPPYRKHKNDKTSWKPGGDYGVFGASWMPLCANCGNKRCPGAWSHNNPCSGTNDPNQYYSPDLEGYVAPPWEKLDMTEEEYQALPTKKRIELFFSDEEVNFYDEK